SNDALAPLRPVLGSGRPVYGGIPAGPSAGREARPDPVPEANPVTGADQDGGAGAAAPHLAGAVSPAGRGAPASNGARGSFPGGSGIPGRAGPSYGGPRGRGPAGRVGSRPDRRAPAAPPPRPPP